MLPDVRATEIAEELKRVRPAYGDVTQVHPLIKGHGHRFKSVDDEGRRHTLPRGVGFGASFRVDVLEEDRTIRDARRLPETVWALAHPELTPIRK